MSLRESVFFKAVVAMTTVLMIYLGLTLIARFSFIRSFESFNHIAQAIEDIRFTDLVMSDESRLSQRGLDRRITIIGCNGTRGEIGRLLDTLIQLKPKVVGLDYHFSDKSDRSEMDGTEILVKAMETAWELNIPVIVGREVNLNHETKQITEISIINQLDPYRYGDLSILLEGRHSTVRYFTPFKGDLPSFAVAVAKVAEPQKVKVLRERNNETEIINFINNANDERYQVIDADYLPDYPDLKSNIENKIVLIGINDRSKPVNHRSLGDIFYTPLNESFIGRSAPDMYGVEVQAQILSMILDENYINKSNRFIYYSIAFLLLYIIMICFLLSTHIFHHLLVIVLRFVFGILLYFYARYLFYHSQTYFEISPILGLLIISLEGYIIYEFLSNRIVKKPGKKFLLTVKKIRYGGLRKDKE